MRILLLALMSIVLLGCTKAELQKGKEASTTTKNVATEGAKISTNPVVVGATGGTSLLAGELLAAIAAAAWATERFFSWRIKLKEGKSKNGVQEKKV